VRQRRAVLTAGGGAAMLGDSNHLRLGVLLVCVVVLSVYWEVEMSGRFGDAFVSSSDVNAHVLFVVCFGYVLLMLALSLFTE